MADTPWKDLVDCDVQDKERLDRFRAKLREWKRCLNDENDPHSIQKQFETLIWEDAIYRTFYEACGLLENTKDTSIGLPTTFTELLRNGFFTRQLMAVRRLIEPLVYNPKKAVYSLRSLLDDIGENQQLFSRENYVCYDGLTYEQVSGENPRIEYCKNWRHSKYNILSGKTEGQRCDPIKEGFFAGIKSHFGTFSALEMYVNNFVAHASHPNNRPSPSQIEDQITLEYLDKCYRELFYIAKGIGLLLDDNCLCNVSVPNFDQLENWDKPIVTFEGKKNLYEYWGNRSEEIDEWSKEATDHYRSVE